MNKPNLSDTADILMEIRHEYANQYNGVETPKPSQEEWMKRIRALESAWDFLNACAKIVNIEEQRQGIAKVAL